MAYLLSLIVALGILYSIDLSFLSGSITCYEIRCDKGTSSCEPISSSTYRPEVDKQQVILKSNVQGAVVFSNCDVYDRKNWKCENEDRTADLGATGGKCFYEYNVTEEGMRKKSAWDKAGDYKQVSRIQYLLTTISQFFNK